MRGNLVRDVSVVFLVGAVLTAALPVMGQYYIQQGNYMDANNRLGSGGLNYGARDYRSGINSGNRLISGNVTGGQAFRGLSTVRDPSDFYLGTPTMGGGISGSGMLRGAGYLPSDSLSSFSRDSANVADLRRMQGRSRMDLTPYYAPGSTVTNTGQILGGLNTPGTSQVRNPYESLRMDYRAQMQNPLDVARAGGMMGSPLSIDPRLVRATTGQTTGRVNERLLGSALFGGVHQIPISQVAAQTGDSSTASAGTTRTTTGNVAGKPRVSEGSLYGPGQQGTAMDRLLGGPTGGESAGVAEQGRQPGEPTQVLVTPSEAGTLAARMGPAEKPSGAGDRRPSGRLADQPPLPTFVGTPDQRLNEQLAMGEELLKQGRYYDAARRYGAAHVFHLDNPLPMFGRAMALLAAGDFVSSANDLFAGIQFAGVQGAPRVDIKHFVPDLAVLDQRRAFLEQRLESVEDFRLRFLLGWTEYMSGMAEQGLANMTKAVELAPPQLDAVRDYVEALRRQPTNQVGAPASRPE